MVLSEDKFKKTSDEEVETLLEEEEKHDLGNYMLI